MSKEEISNETAALVRLARITVPRDRMAALAAGLTGTKAAAAAIRRYDYAVIEPTSRFVPPPHSPVGKGPSPDR